MNAAEPLGLYVHVPFCEAKCAYCHFAIDPGQPGEERQARYTRALLAEIAGRDGAGTGHTLYFGGGTPSLLSRDRLARVFEALRERFAPSGFAEATLEANPRDLGRDGYRELRALGVDRLSLGVQARDDGVLREMGRLHTAEDSEAAVADARAAGFANVSLDLILGWAGESKTRWQRTLSWAAALQPDHVSLYLLEVEDKTALSHWRSRGRVELPPDDLLAELYERTVEFLGARGFERYEISNFARPGFESRHNARYWDDAPFLGFGMSAHSYVDGCRAWNRPTYVSYCTGVETRGARGALAGERRLSSRERRGEALFTGLRRRAGIDLAAFRERYGVDPLAEHELALRECQEARLVEVRDGRLRLTERGCLLSNEVFRAFV